MEYVSVIQFADKYGISRTARNYCATGKIGGAFLTGKHGIFQQNAALLQKGKYKIYTLFLRLRVEKESRLKGGIYHRAQN